LREHWRRHTRKGRKADKAVRFPTVVDGVKGAAFVEAVVSSSNRGGRWVTLASH